MAPLTLKYILILKVKLFVSFLTTLPGIQNESFFGRNYMNAAGLRQNMEIKLKKLQTINTKVGNSSNFKLSKINIKYECSVNNKIFFYCNAGIGKIV